VNGYYANYHFRVPYLCLIDGADIYKMALYPDVTSDLTREMSAYYILDEDSPIHVPVGGGNFTIIID